jgi:hypothetical protein
MAAQVGKRYIAASGAELIVTKGGDGALQDGDTPLNIKEDGPPAAGSNGAGDVALGKRYASGDGSVEVLCIKPGALDLRYDGAPMELMQPKVLPSAD